MVDGVGIPLLSGAYQARSLIASAQRCYNLYPELNPQNIRAPVPVTHYPRPGKIKRWSPPALGRGRGLYCASNGDLYAVVNGTVYFVNSVYATNVVGNIQPGSRPVSMADNGISGGQQIALVDGTSTGYEIDMPTYSMAPIIDGTGLFTGADKVAYLQTYFIFNTIPNTQNFIISEPNSLTFDALDIAAKASYADDLITLGIRSKELFLIGNKQSTEPWVLSGAADFAFEAIPSTFIQFGSAAKYSLINADTTLFWLSIDNNGQGVVMKLDGYTPRRVSTHAVEEEIQNYLTITDCVGTSYQIAGHTFIQFTFPTANATWIFDSATEQWFKSTWTDDNGGTNRDRALFYAAAYNKVFGQDWETGEIYEISDQVYSDDGRPVQYVRGFPVIEKSLNRISHSMLRAYMEMGTDPDVNAEEPAIVLLFISDDNGRSFYDPVELSIGKMGEYDTIAQTTQLGEARTRVYELVWSAAVKTALNGIYIWPEGADS